jgi:hypothetical protein
MHTSGLVLDVYDDAPGDVLRSIFSSTREVPEFIKNAHQLSHDEREALPDDAYGLVLINNGEKLRKFACVDDGNTAMHVLYFLKTAHLLPEEAQKVAALRLLDACRTFKLDEPEELQKTAGVMSSVAGATANGALNVAGKMGPLQMMALPGMVQGTRNQVKQNLAEASAHGGNVMH